MLASCNVMSAASGYERENDPLQSAFVVHYIESRETVEAEAAGLAGICIWRYAEAALASIVDA